MSRQDVDRGIQPGYMRPTRSARWRWGCDDVGVEDLPAGPMPRARRGPRLPGLPPRFMQHTASSRAKLRPAGTRPLGLGSGRVEPEPEGQAVENVEQPEVNTVTDPVATPTTDVQPEQELEPQTPPRRRLAVSAYITSVDSAADGVMGSSSKANRGEGSQRGNKASRRKGDLPRRRYLGKENVSPMGFGKGWGEEGIGDGHEWLRGRSGSLARQLGWPADWRAADAQLAKGPGR
ncbi:unnamed protein product [Ostreobium quekettii]|uniref:Uncharacterized protein n=1 Tax=Ostreobium quekettii TaxID=121088 RepID=A0A8S1J3S8_9CHLO|nr:unnamed protein product [Ostreobium quekettii]|eukprot:evm.model.scf_2290.2 EVM.evm.TU.scf_2290.2   scf_2290:4123-5925(+)